MIRKYVAALLLASGALASSAAYADAAEDQATFQAIFSNWTKAFNEKRYPEVCDLFSGSLVADYQGAPKKDYASICNGFKNLFAEKSSVHHNDFRMHQIYRTADLATVRITWYLDVYKDGAHVSSVQEEGLDVFQKQEDGKWKIVNFIAYPVPPGK